MWFTANTDVSFLIEYIVDGEFVIPSSATATVLNNGGQPIAGLVDVPLAVDTTQATLTVPAMGNTVDAEKQFESRFLAITMVHGGRTHLLPKAYKLYPFQPITATTEDVRRVMGLGTSEVSDAEIDLIGAYIKLQSTYGDVVTTALTSGDDKTLAVNEAIAVRAALVFTDGLQFRAAVKIKAEDSAIERMSDFDVDKIRVSLGRRLASLMSVVEGVEYTTPPTMTVSRPTDVITG